MHQRGKLIVNALILLLSFIGMFSRKMDVDETSFIDRFFIDTIASVQELISSSYGAIEGGVEKYLVRVSVGEKNRHLLGEVSQLKSQIFQLEEVQKENQRLKKLLSSGKKIRLKKILSQVVSWDAASHSKVIRVNKGAESGVKLQSVAITSEGVAGYVFRMTQNFSDILTTLDPKNRVDGIVVRSRSHGILEGDGKDRYILKFVTRAAQLKIRDEVITSGLGHIYPKGIKIGMISRIERESYGMIQYVEVLPSIDFSRLEEVILLVREDEDKQAQEWGVLDKI